MVITQACQSLANFFRRPTPCKCVCIAPDGTCDFTLRKKLFSRTAALHASSSIDAHLHTCKVARQPMYVLMWPSAAGPLHSTVHARPVLDNVREVPFVRCDAELSSHWRVFQGGPECNIHPEQTPRYHAADGGLVTSGAGNSEPRRADNCNRAERHAWDYRPVAALCDWRSDTQRLPIVCHAQLASVQRQHTCTAKHRHACGHHCDAIGKEVRRLCRQAICARMRSATAAVCSWMLHSSWRAVEQLRELGVLSLHVLQPCIAASCRLRLPACLAEPIENQSRSACIAHLQALAN